MKGCVSFGTRVENAPWRLPAFGDQSTQRSCRQPLRITLTYSSPIGARPSQIQSTAFSNGTLCFLVVSGAHTSYGFNVFTPNALRRTRQYLCQSGRFFLKMASRLWN